MLSSQLAEALSASRATSFSWLLGCLSSLLDTKPNDQLQEFEDRLTTLMLIVRQWLSITAITCRITWCTVQCLKFPLSSKSAKLH